MTTVLMLRFSEVAREELSSALLNPNTDVCIWLADRLYQQSVNVLTKARDDWLKEHVKTCDVRSLGDSRTSVLTNIVYIS